MECRTIPENLYSCQVHLSLPHVHPTFQLTACTYGFLFLEVHLPTIHPPQNWVLLLPFLWNLSLITTIYRAPEGERVDRLWLQRVILDCSSSKCTLNTYLLVTDIEHLLSARPCTNLSTSVITRSSHNTMREITLTWFLKYVLMAVSLIIIFLLLLLLTAK